MMLPGQPPAEASTRCARGLVAGARLGPQERSLPSLGSAGQKSAVAAGWGQVLRAPALAPAPASTWQSCLGQREEFWTPVSQELTSGNKAAFIITARGFTGCFDRGAQLCASMELLPLALAPRVIKINVLSPLLLRAHSLCSWLTALTNKCFRSYSLE